MKDLFAFGQIAFELFYDEAGKLVKLFFFIGKTIFYRKKDLSNLEKSGYRLCSSPLKISLS